jgi:hypothetical protein
MRWFFLFLLIINVIYLGYEINRGTRIYMRNTTSALSIPADATRLQLISELDAPAEIRIRAGTASGLEELDDVEIVLTTNEELVAELPEIQPGESGAFASSIACFRYGPIPDEQMVRGLYDWFRSRDIEANIQYTEEQQRQMYWVYLSPQQSRETALAVIQEMESKGIGDFRLISRGDLENAISLGLYSSRDSVNNRLQELNDKGYVPVVVPYSNVTRIYWLDTRITNSALSSDEIYNGFPARYKFVPVNCNDSSNA